MPDTPDEPDVADVPDEQGERGEPAPTDVVVRPLPQAPADLRSRTLALRAALPQLARNPVVVGAAAAAATVVARLAVDVARRAILDAPGRSMTLDVQGSVQHEVHVVHHVLHHVVHHVVHHDTRPPVALWLPVTPPRR